MQILFDSWNWLKRERGFELFGYVILENHLHLIARAPELANAIKSFKMHTAKHIIELLDAHHAETLLQQLRATSWRTRPRATTRSGRKAAIPSRSARPR